MFGCTRLAAACALMALGTVTDAAALSVDRVVLVQPILLTSNGVSAYAPYAEYESALDKIWAQAGLDLSFLSAVMHEDPANMSLAIEELVASEPGREASFFAGSHGQSLDPLVVNMWFARSITSGFSFDSILGVTNAIFDSLGQPTFMNEVVMAEATFPGNYHAMAHELGHVFGLEHVDPANESCAGGDASNLMAACAGLGFSGSIDDIVPDGDSFFELTSAQIAAVRLSPYAQPVSAVPLPPAMLLFAGGLCGMLLAQLKRPAAQAGSAAD